MKLSKSLPLILAAVTFLVPAFSAYGQKRPDFNRAQVFDAQHYVLRVSFDSANKKVSGDTTIVFKPLANELRSVEFDAVGLSIESVVLEPSGVALAYKVLASKVGVTLDKAYGPQDTVSVRIKYTAKPKKGIYFVDATDRHSAQIWTQGEPDEARHWFPSFDFPSDKATTEQYITADVGETVVGNGEFLEKNEAGAGKVTWHFKMAVPHSVYLVSFVIGKYTRVEDKHGDIPLGFYVYPGNEKTAKNAYGRTVEMMKFFEESTGVLYPYNKYDQTVVASFQFGGMENITATTMADTEISMADTEFGQALVTDLVSHELAHSWFGNLVTCRNWAELWLNEGFATFMEAAYREKAFGRQNYLNKIRSDAAQFLVDDSITRRRHGLFNLRAGDVDALFDNAAVTYNKGGVVVHMLREQVGDKTFWKAINSYLNRHKFGSVESSDLKKAMEEASGQDLAWFFDQWVYGAGAPSLDVKSTYRKKSKTLTVTVAQTQIADSLVPSTFRLPIRISANTASGSTELTNEITKRVQTFTIKLADRPVSISVDEEEKVPLKKLKIRPVVTVN